MKPEWRYFFRDRFKKGGIDQEMPGCLKFIWCFILSGLIGTALILP